MMSTGKDNAFCFDYLAKRLIVFSDELAKTRMYKRRWKRELNSDHYARHAGLVVLMQSIIIYIYISFFYLFRNYPFTTGATSAEYQCFRLIIINKQLY